jgi:hypothetical protein
MALSGEALFIGGDFLRVGAAPRQHLAAISASSGEVLSWRCDADGAVLALASEDTTLFVGGAFGVLGGRAHGNLGASSTQDGRVLDWVCDTDDWVTVLASRDSLLYAGGYFGTVRGMARRCLAVIRSGDGVLQATDFGFDRQPPSTRDGGPHVRAMLFSGDTLIVGGSFSHVGGLPRKSLAQLDVSAGRPTDWNPAPVRATILGSEIFSLARVGSSVFIAAASDSIAGSACGMVSAVDVSTGVRVPWDPLANDIVFSLAAADTSVYLGGLFNSVVDWAERRGLAAIDEVTGAILPWNPAPDNYVQSLLLHDGRLYVGGYFASIGGAPRSGLAALDLETGGALPWDPQADAGVWALSAGHGVIYAGGPFLSFVGGQRRRGVAALDPVTGLATPWNPDVVPDVFCIRATDSCVYVGGDFVSAGGQPRSGLAALDPLTGSALPWDPSVYGSVSAIASLDTTLYIGGSFSAVGGHTRSNLAAIGPSGIALPWAPDPDFSVQALAARDSSILAGGFFSTVSGVSNEWYSVLDAKTAMPRPGVARPNGQVWTILVDHDTTYVGGAFGRFSSQLQVGVAAIRPTPTTSPPLSTSLLLSPCVPNPAVTSTLVRYSLPQASTVDLGVYDLAGRRVVHPLDGVFEEAGRHQVSINTTQLSSGCYFLSLAMSGHRAARKFVVVH